MPSACHGKEKKSLVVRFAEKCGDQDLIVAIISYRLPLLIFPQTVVGVGFKKVQVI